MVADAIGRPPAPSPVSSEEEVLESGLRENLERRLAPLLRHLQNPWVIVAIFVFALAPFGARYWYAYQDLTDLNTQIDAREALLAEPEPPAEDIEAGLQTWTAALEAASEAQILELEDSVLIERLIDTADRTGIFIQSVSTSSSIIVPVGTEVYDATPFIVRVSGTAAQIESFVALLEGDVIEALEIQSLLLSPTEDDVFSGNVRAIVFNRPVDRSELDPEELEALSRRVTDEELDAAASGGRSSQ